MTLEEFRAFFKQITNNEPYPHQLKTFEELAKGNSVILRAPTGSGKSEAVFVPFLALRGSVLPPRLIYSLPMRSLVNQLAERFRSYSQTAHSPSPMRVAAQHGERPESVLFYADAVVATIDQVITSYACAPLTLGVRHGNIPAGAVATGFLVFDEVHTLDPERGLQSALILASRLKGMGIPSVIMTATLPTEAQHVLQERLNLTTVEVDEKEIPTRKGRSVTLELALDQPLTAQTVAQRVKDSKRRVLVVCNTVDRARSLFSQLNGAGISADLLLHSRFKDSDREKLEAKVKKLLGKPGEQGALVVATQVVEVGLDISCDLLLTELCPMDALIQRAGRCARWGGLGRVVVSGLPEENGASTPPYQASLISETVRALEKAAGNSSEILLSWEMEQELVDKALSGFYIQYLDRDKAARAAASLANAAFTGSRRDAEQAVRENDSIEVSLHKDPKVLEGRLRLLTSISVPKGIIRRFVQEFPGTVWTVETDARQSGPILENQHRERLAPIKGPWEVYIGRRYIITSHASYSHQEGLVLGEGEGDNWEPVDASRHTQREDKGPKVESLEQHAQRGLKWLETIVLEKESYGLARLAQWIGCPPGEIRQLLTIAIICHDLGKATEEWQRAAWKTLDMWLQEPGNVDTLTAEERQIVEAGPGKVILARFPSLKDGRKEPPRPAHATVSAYVLWDFLRRHWGYRGGQAALAMAHHHSVRAAEVPEYRLNSDVLPTIEGLVKGAANVDFDKSQVEHKLKSRSSTQLDKRMPPFEDANLYTLYLFISRCLSLSDRMAAGGGEDAVLDYEKWTRNL